MGKIVDLLCGKTEVDPSIRADTSRKKINRPDGGGALTEAKCGVIRLLSGGPHADPEEATGFRGLLTEAR